MEIRQPATLDQSQPLATQDRSQRSEVDSPPGTSVLSFLNKFSGVLNHDFCPWANYYVYWLKNPFWVLVIAAVVALICGIFLSTAVLIGFFTLLGVMLLGFIWPWVALRGIECEVRFERRRIREGQAVEVLLQIANRSPWPVWGLSLQRGFAIDLENNSEGVALSRVRGWAREEFRWRFIPACRGVYPDVTPQLETGFPFGLWKAKKEVCCEAELIVWPQTALLTSMPESAELCPSEEQLSDRRVGDFGDMLGTRTFRNGDSLRRVHWAQTARQGQLIVCERQAPAMCAVRVVLDTDRRHHSGKGAHNSIEQAIRVTASLCESLSRQHASVECTIGEKRLSSLSGERGVRAILDALARIPREGLDAGRSSNGRGLGVDARTLQIVVTTDVGIERRQGRGSAANCKYLAVATHEGTLLHPPHIEGAWIAIDRGEPVEETLPRKWKRACHVG